jgi:hypothetical protein
MKPPKSPVPFGLRLILLLAVAVIVVIAAKANRQPAGFIPSTNETTSAESN